MFPFGCIEFGGEQVKQLSQIRLQFLVLPHLVECGVGFQHVYMGVHCFGSICLPVHATHIALGVVAPERFDIAQFCLVVYLAFQCLIQTDGCLQTPFAACRTEVFCQSVNAKGTGVCLFGGILHIAIAVNSPKDTSELPVNKVIAIVIGSTVGYLSVSVQSVMAISLRESPQNARIEYRALVCLSDGSSVVEHDAKEPAVGIDGLVHPEG